LAEDVRGELLAAEAFAGSVLGRTRRRGRGRRGGCAEQDGLAALLAVQAIAAIPGFAGADRGAG
jgi:hypothetical protein